MTKCSALTIDGFSAVRFSPASEHERARVDAATRQASGLCSSHCASTQTGLNERLQTYFETAKDWPRFLRPRKQDVPTSELFNRETCKTSFSLKF